MRARLALVVIFASVALVFWLSRCADRAPSLPAERPASSVEAPARVDPPAPELRSALELAPDATASKREVLPVSAATAPPADASPARSVLVRVVDKATREPVAGVPVAIAVRFEGQPPEDILRAETAADGTARLSVVYLTVPEGTHVDLGVRIAVVGSGGTFKRFDPLDPPSEPLELRLVPCAPLEVLVVDAQGAPLPIEGEVRLEALVSGSTLTRENEAYAVAPIEGSRARFDFAACSAELSATVIGTRPALARSVEHRDPRAPGELCSIEVVVAAGPELVGRVLDEHGAPAADAPFSLALREGQRSVLESAVTTDAQGRFRAALDPQVSSRTRVRVMLFSGEFGAWTHRADGPLEVALDAGQVDVGDLRLAPVAGRIAGRCVDLEGHPVAGIRVCVVSAPPAYDFCANTDREGRFQLHGSSERVALRAESEELAMVEPVELGLGDHDGVVIKMAPGGGIVACLADGSRLQGLSLRVGNEAVIASADAAGHERGTDWIRWSGFDERRRARAGGLAPGSYRARIYTRHGLMLYEVPEVVVALGVDTLDPRLADLALDHRLRTIAFEVVDAGGAPVQNPLVSILRGAQRIAAVGGDRNGIAEVETVVEPDVEALVTAHGFRPARVVDLAGGPDRRRVALEPGIAVLLRSETRPALEREGRKAGLAFALVEQGLVADWVSVSVPGALALEGEARAVFPGPGRYRLGVSWDSPAEGGMRMVSVPRYDEAGATELLVREEDAEGVLQIDLPDPLSR